MQVKLPAVLGVNAKTRVGRVRQITAPPTTIEARAVRYTLGRSVGHVFQDSTGANLLYLFPARPHATSLPGDAPVLIAGDAVVTDDPLDVTGGTWLTHSAKRSDAAPAASLAAAARASWRGAFQFAEEDPSQAAVGLRKPQAGALHAIHAHWSTSSEAANHRDADWNRQDRNDAGRANVDAV